MPPKYVYSKSIHVELRAVWYTLPDTCNARTLCSCVGAAEGYHSHWSTAQQTECPFACVVYIKLLTSFTNCNNNKHYAPCPKLSIATLYHDNTS